MEISEFKHIFEVTKIRSASVTHEARPNILHASKTMGYVLRGINHLQDVDLAAHSVVHPGIFISLVLNGTAEAGPSKDRLAIKYGDRSLVAVAVSKSMDWFSVSRAGMLMRGVGIAFPADAIEQLGLKPMFDRLFSEHTLFRATRSPASARLMASALDTLEMGHNNDDLDRVLLDAFATEWLVAGLRALADDRACGLRSALRSRLFLAREKIESNLAGDWTLPRLAAETGLGVRSLSTHFREEFGSGVVEYIRNRRLEIARDAITYEGLSVSEAAFQVGYNNPANFATAFRKYFGFPPSACKDHLPFNPPAPLAR